jgi:uncharacterized protein
MNLVIDTNIFIASILSKDGINRQVIRRCLTGEFTPLMGESLYQEYSDLLNRETVFDKCKITYNDRKDLLNAFLNSCHWIKVHYAWRPNLKDEADNHIIELAVAGAAPIIITNNIKDFKNQELFFPFIKINTPKQFMTEN